MMDQHTAYVAEVTGSLDFALRYHLTSRVFPAWPNDHVDRAMPALKRAVRNAARGDYERGVTWVFPGDGMKTRMTTLQIIRGLNLDVIVGAYEEGGIR